MQWVSGDQATFMLRLDQPEGCDASQRKAHYLSQVRSYYECVTAVYREFWGDSYHFALFEGTESRDEALVQTERSLAQEGGFRTGLKILDLGCGLGGPALEIAGHFDIQIMGVDLCEHHVRIAQERSKAKQLEHLVRFVAGDAMSLPFPDASFDRVYVFESGCHTPDKLAFCVECARILKPGGEFLGLDWMQRDGLSPEEQASLIEPICRYCAVPDMISPRMMHEHLEQSQFEILVSDQISSAQSLLPNWISFRPAPDTSSATWDLEALEYVSQGGRALLEATRAGAFVIGHWHARRRP